MKKAFIITSAIEIDQTAPLTYSPSRSCFPIVDRLRHTMMTVANLDLVSDDETTLFLVDMSDNWKQFESMFSYQKNLIFVSVKEKFPEIYNEVRTHPNKSHSESLLLYTFLQKYKEQLKNYDYFVKISGRYFIDSHFTKNEFNEDNLNKIFFKRPLKHDFKEEWNYTMVDRRSIQGDNFIFQYPTTLFGWGKEKYASLVDIFRGIAEILDHEGMYHYDIETLIYYFTRQYDADIVEVNWKIYGWDSAHGTFLRY
jgi:hypothetical protein